MKQKIPTGIHGLDEILHDGLIPNRSYLVKGGPGMGKSTHQGYYFLQKRLEQGEKVLYITLGESKANILDNARKLNIDLSDVILLDISPSGDPIKNNLTYDVFPTSEMEQKPIVQSILYFFKKNQRTQVLWVSITILGFLNKDAFQFRNFGLSFINYVCSNGATLMTISEAAEEDKTDPTFWAVGIIDLTNALDRRKIKVTKYRGTNFMHGNHSFRITGQGAKVFPRLQPTNYKQHFTDKVLSSSIDEIDKLLRGGIEKGTTTLVTGDCTTTNINASYQELDGELQKAIGVLKKRLSNFEKTIRNFKISSDGISVGEPFKGLRGLPRACPKAPINTFNRFFMHYVYYFIQP